MLLTGGSASGARNNKHVGPHGNPIFPLCDDDADISRARASAVGEFIVDRFCLVSFRNVRLLLVGGGGGGDSVVGVPV